MILIIEKKNPHHPAFNTVSTLCIVSWSLLEQGRGSWLKGSNLLTNFANYMQILALINCLECEHLKQKESVEGAEKRDPTPSPNGPCLAHPSLYQICGHSVSEAQWEPTLWPQYSPYLSVG